MSETNNWPMLKITVIKETTEHPPKGSPSVAIHFQGEPMTPADQQRLIECLVSDLVRRLDDHMERAWKLK